VFAKQLGKTFRDGEIIFEEGSTGRDMFVIQSGQVEIVTGKGEAETVLAVLGKGEIFGEMALFERLPRSATVRAKGSARVLTVDPRTFLSKVSADPTLAFEILKRMSKRVRRLDIEVRELRSKLGRLGGADMPDGP